MVPARFGREIENSTKFTFYVIWTSMEAHVDARTRPTFQTFRSCFGDLSVGGAMSHFMMDKTILGPFA